MSHRRVTLSTSLLLAGLVVCCFCLRNACGVSDDKMMAIKLALNWVPEPEFGGFYQAQIDGEFAKAGLRGDVTIEPGGAGAPVTQRIAAGQVDFGIVSADEVVIARSQGAKIIAIFAAYQTCPQGIMTHASRGVKSLKELFAAGGTIAMEPGLPYVKFLEKKYGFDKVKVVSYTGGIAQFLNGKDFSQQCFITSEPLAAKQKGGDPQTFLIADSGYNPYTAVVATSEDFLAKHPGVVKSFVAAVSQGWRSYLKNPAAANASMGKLNPQMDAQTFADAAKAQAPLIELQQDPFTLGQMSEKRWSDLVGQLKEMSIIESAPPAKECFTNLMPRDKE